MFYELNNYDVNYFWHEEDKIIITSKAIFGIILEPSYPQKVYVMPEKNNIKKQIV